MKLVKRLLVLGVSGALAHGVLAQQSQQPGESSAQPAQRSHSAQPGQAQSQQPGQAQSQQPGQAQSQQRQSEQQSPERQAQQRPGQQAGQQQAGQQQAGQRQAGQQAGQSGQGLEALVSEHDNLSTFVRALQETGLAESIMGEGQSYTAFAPTNEAFEQHGDMEELMQPQNREQLIELLRNHLIADEVDAERAGELGQALTVSGRTLSLSEENGELTVNGAQVEDTDIRAGNLTVHTVEEVLEPTGLGASASAASQQQRQGAQAGQSSQAQASSQQQRPGAAAAGQSAGQQSGQSQAGQRQAGQSQAGQPQAGQPQAGQPQAGQRQAGQSQAGQAQPGQSQAGQQQGQASERAGARPSFEDVDLNSDGQIGRAEFARVEGLDFSDVDTNQDGNISRQEYMNATQQE